MLAAELAGKTSSTTPPHERMEDVLTSNVFSSFRYLNKLDIISRFLKRAKNIGGDSLALDDLVDFEAYFWPKFRFLGTGKREPDAVLFATDINGKHLSFIVEAKLDSGLHNASNKQVIGADNDKIELGHQLADQYCSLHCGKWDHKEIANKLNNAERKYLIYLTAHYSFPQVDMKSAKCEIDARYNKNIKGCGQSHCQES